MRLTGRYDRFLRRLRGAVLDGDGVTPGSTRRAVEATAAAVGGRPSGAEPGSEAVPPPLRELAEKVARHAYRVTDADIAAVRESGHGEDAVFEVVVATAVGAGCGRLERGLAALRGEV